MIRIVVWAFIARNHTSRLMYVMERHIVLRANRRQRHPPSPHLVQPAETTVKGIVEELKRGPNQGMHVMLKTSDTTLELALGPSWYQTEKKYVLAKGDQIDVTGARSTVEGREVVLVREIKKGSETMTFRPRLS